MFDSWLRFRIASLLKVSALLEWANHWCFLWIDSTSEELVRRRWEMTRDRTRR